MKRLKFFIPGLGLVLVVLFVLFGTSSTHVAQTAKNDIATAYSVAVITASKAAVSNSLELVGTIVANNDVVVLSETQGRVIKTLVEVGDQVQAGQILVQVDDELKRAAFTMAEVNYQKSKKDLDRYESVYKDGSVSDAQLEGARLAFKTAESQYIIARRQYNDTKVSSPIAGVVAARMVNVGTMVMGAPQATAVANVVDISRLKVRINVTEKDVFRLNVGDKVDVTTDVFAGMTFPGTIFSISSKGDEVHTYPVEVRIENPKRQLKAGMFGRVTFAPRSSTNELLIPREAVVGSLRAAKVFVVENNAARLRTIAVGAEVGTNVEVLSGLTEGEVVVVNGQNNLKDNSPVIVRK